MHDILQGDHQQRGDDDHHQLIGGDDEAPDGKIDRGKHGRKRARRRAKKHLAGILEEQRDADGGDEDVERGRAAERPVGQALDGHAQHGATDHCDEEDDQAAPDRALGDVLAGIVADEGADHEDIGVGEINEAQHAVDHRVAERDERVDRPEGKAVEELLEEFGQAAELKGER